jgi:hypothetical protein
LVSQEALVCLESQALLISETTQRIERGHAEVKRGQRCREQTHLERTAMASALRVLRLQRCDVATTVPRRFRHRGSQRTDDPQAPDPSRRPRANDTRGRRRKRRKPSLWQAWVSLSGEGWAERNAGQKYRPAIAQPHIRKRCQQSGADVVGSLIGPVNSCKARSQIADVEGKGPSIRLLRGPNETRAAADEGRLILEV